MLVSMRLLLLTAFAAAAFAQPADLVLRNGKIVTMNAAAPAAQAIAVRGDRIVALGQDGRNNHCESGIYSAAKNTQQRSAH